MINLPKCEINDLEFNVIQGGMGVGISMRGLASAVANCGGAGIIASVELGSLKGHKGKRIEVNRNALRDEIRATRKMSPNGVLGVNIMEALTDYNGLVEVVANEDINLIIVGAGITKNLSKLVGNKPISLVPIVSSGRGARIICRLWERQDYLPDSIIVEGPKAGGHLGFKREQLKDSKYVENALEGIVREVLYESEKFGKIPIIAAGGIYYGKDIKEALSWGASGVQMGTRFVTTKECDSSDQFKRTYIDSTKNDLMIVHSPVGMPGRVIRKGDFFDRNHSFKCSYNCLKTCEPDKSPYCITKALIAAQQGDFEKGFVFAGMNAYRATPESCLDVEGNFITVKKLFEDLTKEYHSS